MNSWVLDIDTFSLFQDGNPKVVERCGAVARGPLAVTIISVEEQFLGWHTRRLRCKPTEELETVYQRFTALATFVGQVRVLPFTAVAIARFASLKALSLNVGKNDLRIAAIVMEAGDVVVTRNTRDFGRIPQLKVEDWTV